MLTGRVGREAVGGGRGGGQRRSQAAADLRIRSRRSGPSRPAGTAKVGRQMAS